MQEEKTTPKFKDIIDELIEEKLNNLPPPITMTVGKAGFEMWQKVIEEVSNFKPTLLNQKVEGHELKKTPYDVCFRQDLFKGKPLIGMKEAKGIVTENLKNNINGYYKNTK